VCVADDFKGEDRGASVMHGKCCKAKPAPAPPTSGATTAALSLTALLAIAFAAWSADPAHACSPVVGPCLCVFFLV
jgi:hypothetical protein